MLGEIYAQALAAAGYKVKTELNLGDEKIALKALKSGADRRLPRVHGHGADCRSSTSRPTRLPKDPQEAYEEAKADFAKEGITAFAADAVHRAPTRSR